MDVAEILNKQSQIAEKGHSPSLDVMGEPTVLHRSEVARQEMLHTASELEGLF
jgi:hypothetical protein